MKQNHIPHKIEGISPFHVMQLPGRAKELEVKGCSIIHIEVGEPDFTSPEPVIPPVKTLWMLD